jgi:hypothetical protein
MDPGSIGGLIGVGCLVAVGIGVKVYDVWKEQKRTKEMNPLLTLVRQHSKMNMVIPK